MPATSSNPTTVRLTRDSSGSVPRGLRGKIAALLETTARVASPDFRHACADDAAVKYTPRALHSAACRARQQVQDRERILVNGRTASGLKRVHEVLQCHTDGAAFVGSEIGVGS